MLKTYINIALQRYRRLAWFTLFLAVYLLLAVAMTQKTAAYETRSPYDLIYNLGGTESDYNKAYEYYAYQPPNNPVDSAPFVHVINDTPYSNNINGFRITGLALKCAVDIAVQNQQQAGSVSVSVYGTNTTLYNFGRSGYRQLYRAVISLDEIEIPYINITYNGSISSYPLQVSICGYHVLENNTTDLQTLNRERPFTNFWTSPVDQITYNYTQTQSLLEEIDRLNGLLNGADGVIMGDIGTPRVFATIKFANDDNLVVIDSNSYPTPDEIFSTSDRGVFIKASFYGYIANYCIDILGMPSSKVIERIYLTVTTDTQFWSTDTPIYLQSYSSLMSLNGNVNTNKLGYVDYSRLSGGEAVIPYEVFYNISTTRLSWKQNEIVNVYDGYMPISLRRTIDQQYLDLDPLMMVNAYYFDFIVQSEIPNSIVTLSTFDSYEDENEFFFSFGAFAYSSQVYQQGFNDGSTLSYSKGYDRGYLEGYRIGNENKHAYGEERYNAGITAALENTDAYGFTGLFGAVTSVPVNIFRAIFNFEILGTNISAFLFSIITIIVVIAALKFFFL